MLTDLLDGPCPLMKTPDQPRPFLNDAPRETAQKFAVQSMPTFIMLKNGKKVDEIKGAGADALRQAISRNT